MKRQESFKTSKPETGRLFYAMSSRIGIKHLAFALILGSVMLWSCVQPVEQKLSDPVTFEVEETFEGHLFAELPYAYDALEPYIDAQTMELHYSKHHRGYYNNFLKAIEGSELVKVRLENIFKHVSTLSEAIRNNGGGYFNHTLFWASMAGNATSTYPSAELMAAFERDFGSFDAFKEKFSTAAKTRFGSGWAWLSVDAGKKLFVSSTANQDNPLMDVVEERGTPVLALDVWEHAYYLKYQNKRADYVDNFWNVINWEEVNKRYAEAVQ